MSGARRSAHGCSRSSSTRRRRTARASRALPLSSLAGDGADEPAVDPDRFQSDESPWAGYWAAPPRPWQKPERRLLSLEARERLKAALAELPERQRLIVALRDIEGMSAEEVCTMLNLSQENQRVLLHRGRSRLRAALEQYVDEEDSPAADLAAAARDRALAHA
ncbi:MAG TPA: sigma-70 family RNA polymerase sigma factor [Solirubrobacteraceae bacterium]|nr:sigma-70 family RNA polymerase sigma factor [Solirubrobacteraceae bacterium]